MPGAGVRAHGSAAALGRPALRLGTASSSGEQGPCSPLSRLCLAVPSAYGTLTVRSLLDTREHCLNEFSFPDPYSKVSAPWGGRVHTGAAGGDWGRPALCSESISSSPSPCHWAAFGSCPGEGPSWERWVAPGDPQSRVSWGLRLVAR